MPHSTLSGHCVRGRGVHVPRRRARAPWGCVASAPVQGLAEAIAITKQFKGQYSAGDADNLNSQTLEPTESWKSAWKGKTR